VPCFKILLTDIVVGVNSDVQWMFCIAIATILLVVVAITKIMEEDDESRSYIRPVSRLLVIISVCVLAYALIQELYGNDRLSFSDRNSFVYPRIYRDT
jgi:hypothetical protein